MLYMKKDMKFGENLKMLRAQHKMSQKALAEKINVKQNMISQYENGTYYPSFEKIVEIADVFGVSIDALTFGLEKELDEEIGQYEKVFSSLEKQAVLKLREDKADYESSKKYELDDEAKKRILEMIEFEYYKMKKNAK